MDERPYGRAHAKIPCTSEGACERSRRARPDAAFPPAASHHHGLFQKKKANREDTCGGTWRSCLGASRPCLRRTWLFSCLVLQPPPGALSVCRPSRAGWAPRHGLGIRSQRDPQGTAAPVQALERLKLGDEELQLGGHLCHWCGTVGPIPAPWGALHCWFYSLQRLLRGCGGCPRYGAACRSFTHPLCLSACCCPGSRVSWVERGSRFLLCAHGGGLVSTGAVLQRGLPPVPPGWQPGSCSLSWQLQPG